jgi:hypothetical protein
MKIIAKFMVHWLRHNHSPETLTNDRLSKFKTRRYRQSLIQHCRTRQVLHKLGCQALFSEIIPGNENIKSHYKDCYRWRKFV